ncbi:snRNA-activating protein complex subunit 1b [Salarias fasciatus]|uniref:snRNA-activating protein complex subunit 1b n=1 Tax=Salarias fasciatus TaxID=181472 RepID=UPI001176BCA9|nr:snRNA-activating protein complex subunit 1 [Salarias fasciatus]
MEDLQAQAKADCEELLRRFQETQSVRYEIFSKIWREMKFSDIFSGITARHEKRAFSRTILDSAYPFFLPPFSFQIRVGGLYLLFGLYQTQRVSPPEQVRLALKDWDEVKKLEKDAVDAQHYDVVYVLRKLEACGAFSYTAMPQLLAFRKKRKAEPLSSSLREEFMERTSRPQELINIELLEELSNVHKLYDNLKKSVFSPALRAGGAPGAPGDRGDRGVDLVRADLVPQLRGTVLDFYKWQLTQDRSLKDEDSGEGTSSSQQSSRRAELLAAIKSKAYGEAAEATKSRRHRQVELDTKSPESRPSSSSRKPSLKARTRESLHRPGSVWAEDSSTTHISRLTSLQPEKH